MKILTPPMSFVLAAAAAMIVAGASMQASEGDDRIEAAFKQSYVFKTYLKDDSVKPVAKDGTVTLTGTVEDESHKLLAQETAANLPGVTKVDNQLATKAEVTTLSADAWIVRKLRLALVFHRNVSASSTTITAKDGVVTLTGEAASSAQRDLTGEYAKDIEGVKGVKNEMTIAKMPDPVNRTAAEMVDDASIAAQVKMAFTTHRSTSSLKTAVSVRNGEVGLTGVASNAAEKALVTKLVEDIHGVKSVKNQMTIADPAGK